MPRIYYVLALLIGMTLIVSWSANPPDGRTGAPGDGNCSDCHSLNGGGQDGSIVVTGFPATITPSTAYVLTITNSNPNGMAAKAGFQMTILNSSNNIAGSMTSPGPNSVVTPSAGREYWEHSPSQNYPGNNMVQWTVTWTSPAGPPNEMITFYAAGNVANGNFNDNGDLIVNSSGSGMLDGGAGPLMVEIINAMDPSCAGGEDGSALADATEGTPPYSYLWSNGQTTAELMNVGAGMYSVTVTDAAAATETASVELFEPDAIVFDDPVITNISCFGETDGAITASATGGTGSISYSWSNGGSGATISGLAAGSYTVTATDANGCTGSDTYEVTEPGLVEIVLVELNHESCAGQEDGSITIETFGGTGVLFAEWSNGFIGNTIEDLTPGDYSVTVTDENGCTATDAYTINAGGMLEVTLNLITNVSCNGGNDGSISISASGGQEPYAYAWSNGDTGPEVSNLPAGNYLVTVSDDQGCEVVEFYTVTEPSAVGVTINATGENLCANDNMVDLEALPSGGTAPYTGTWSNGVDGFINNDLAAGTYTITITDASGCTGTGSAVVTEPAALTVTVMTTHETSVDANDGTATANPMGGTGDYTYSWSNGETTQMISNLAPGVYMVTVTDANGCTAVKSATINAFGCLLDVTQGPDVEVCEGDTLILMPTVSGEMGDITYLWQDGSNLATFEVTAAGEYCVTVTDDSGCEDSDCIIIIPIPFPVITCPVMHESAPGLNDGAIMCDSLSGSIAYLWSTGETTPGISGLAPGDYCVTLTDTASGCVSEQCFTVQEGGCALVVTAIVEEILCSGDSNGSISVTVENATLPISYLWSTGETTSTIGNLHAGDYDVTITDGAGCDDQLTYTLVDPDPLVITVDTVGPVLDFNSGLIYITVTGGTPPYQYLWTDPMGQNFMDEDLENLANPGYYSVMVSDANGCEVSMDSILVEAILAVKPGIQFDDIKVYPVPTQDVLTIDYERQMTEVYISGIDGRTYSKINHPVGNQLNVADLQEGMYVLRMTDGTSWFVARIVK